MKSLMIKGFAIVAVLFATVFAFAQAALPVLPVVPEGDINALLISFLDLVKNWKVYGSIGGLSILLFILMEVVKVVPFIGAALEKKGTWVKQSVVILLGQLAALLAAVYVTGGHWGAPVLGLISSGGAMALYNAIKPFFAKK